MQYLEAEVQPLNYHTWLYFCWIETATVGYGDINALSDLSRVAVMIFIGMSLILLPKMTNQLLDKMGQYSFYQRVVYKPKARSKHVLVCGDMASTSVNEFFEELFHEDHDVGNMMAIILQPTPPTPEMRSILSHPDLSLSTVYVEGTALNTGDLERCCADTAVGIFVLTNKFSANPDEEDTKTILRLFSIRRYCHVNNPFMTSFICLQLIRPENQRHLETQAGSSSSFSDDNDNSNIIVCINKVKMGVIAKSSNYPGTSTLIMNLLTSFADEDDDEDDAGNDDDDDDVGSWLDEYNRGCDWEIYVTDLSDSFCGQFFCDLSSKLYSLYGVLLFALHVRDISGKAASRILVNPLDYRIPSFDDFVVQGIVMAKNKNASDLTFSGDGVDSLQSNNANQLVQLQLASLGGRTGIPDTQIRESRGHHDIGSSERVGSSVDDSILRNPDGYPSKPIKPTLSWQTLMRKHDADKNANESHQEKLQNLEDAHLRENFYIREKRVPISQVTITTSVSDEIPHLSNHIIILGKGLSNMYDLIRPLRAKSLGLLRYIVIVNPTEIPHAIWQRISIFEGIFFVRGSALEENDLRRAGIFRASKVVVLAAAVSNPEEIREMGALVDADAIFSYQAVKRLNERAHCVIEIVRQSSIAYLNNDDSVGGGENKSDTYRFSPQFAGGVLYISSMLDTLSVQTFYNPLIIGVLEKLIGSQRYDVDVDNTTDTGGGGGGRKIRGLAAVKSSSLYQIAIPDGLESRTYGALFRHLAQTGVIPIGLFRGVFPQMKVGSKNNKMSYVYTNPTKDTELFSCDKVFVLSPIPMNKLTSKVN